MIQRICESLSGDGNNLGNKGKFLCMMYGAGFQVPDGIILDREEYTCFIRENGIEDALEGFLQGLTAENIEETSLKIRNLFDGTGFGESMRKRLEEAVNPSAYYAVRSSGTKEDLEDHSFAGQYDTFLNIRGVEYIEKAVINCYRSMFLPVSLSYFVNQSIEVEDMAMAVVIQEMVQADCSGICFTVNPITGKDTEMSIEVAEGLGDEVVSGKVAPEQYYYDWREKKGSFEKKNHLLTVEQLKEYGEIFLKVQLLFGYPCDIEFAICDGQIYLLQARRITCLNYSGLKDIWTTADFKDGGVSASVCTPYMWSLYEYIWEFTLRKYLIDGKILSAKETDCKLGEMFYGRCYWNLSVVKLAMSKVIGYREREFDSEYGIRATYEGEGHITKATPGTLWAITKMFFAQRRILKERNENSEAYRLDLLEKYGHYRKQYNDGTITDIKKEWYELTKRSYLQSEATYFWQIFINTIHQSLYKDSLLKHVSESEYLTLLGAIDNISHMLPFYDMWEISRRIREKEDAKAFWLENEVAVLQEHLSKDFHEMPLVRQLIEKYGYHSDKELDVTYPCYYEDVTPFLTNIRDMIPLGEEYSPLADREKGEAAYKEVLERLEKGVSKRKYRKISEKIANMRKMLWWREEYRDISTRFYYLIRVYTMKLAEQLVAEGILEEPSEIWFLKVGHLWDFMDGKVTKETLQQIIVSNREYYNAYRNYMSENEIGGSFVIDSHMSHKAEPGLKGLGANSGRVTGTARVIENFSEIGKLKENDILVTRFTDTGWTPKFAVLSGIVTEYGGILCHAAIVSREYGIPAIVSCHNVMSKIKDGQTITIDGSTGCIRIEE